MRLISERELLICKLYSVTNIQHCRIVYLLLTFKLNVQFVRARFLKMLSLKNNNIELNIGIMVKKEIKER